MVIIPFSLAVSAAAAVTLGESMISPIHHSYSMAIASWLRTSWMLRESRYIYYNKEMQYSTLSRRHFTASFELQKAVNVYFALNVKAAAIRILFGRLREEQVA